MPFCTFCGSQVAEGAKFCTACGAKLDPAPVAPEAPEMPVTPAEPAQPAEPAVPAQPAEVPEAPVYSQQPEAPVYPQQQSGYSAPQGGYVPPVPPQGGGYVQPGDKKPGGKKTGLIIGLAALAVVIIAAVVILLVKGGGGKSNDPNLGVYNAVSAEMWGVEMPVEDLYAGGFSIELKSGGKCTIIADGTKGSGKWDLDGADFELEGAGLDCEGTLSNGVMTLEDMLDMGLNMTFVLEGHSLPVATSTPSKNVENTAAPSTSKEPSSGTSDSAIQSYWNGEYYGWWYIKEGFGEYEQYTGNWWDCCACIEIGADGSGSIIAWDEDYTRSDLMLDADISIIYGDTDVGMLMSDGGWFMDAELHAYSLFCEPDSMGFWPFSAYYDNMIELTGTYVDPNDSDNYYSYCMYLRPWGDDWSDIEAADSDNLPYYYSDWYLPLIEAGKDMPDSIG